MSCCNCKVAQLNSQFLQSTGSAATELSCDGCNSRCYSDFAAVRLWMWELKNY